MSVEDAGAGSGPHRSETMWSLPGSVLSWWAVALTGAIIPVAWVLVSHAIPWPILDTALAPVLMVTLIDAAAVTGYVSVVRRHERSLLAVAAFAVAALLALLGTAMLLLHVVAPD